MRVLVVGAGVMGRGIAGLCALSGHETLVFDADPDAQRQVRASIEGSWARALERGRIGAEAIEAGRRLLRVVGIHFFNPVAAMPLVEVVRGSDTSAETERRALELVASLGKEAVRVNDSPGFATSRLGLALGLEAMRMVEEGVARPEDIDRAMELGYGHRMGPLKTSDLVGLDVRLAIADTLAAELSGERFTPPGILKKMVAEGKTGKKSGEGFYRWEGDKAHPADSKRKRA
jgi:3-hydroxybutyryl-CoA dehydrogenase